MKRYFLLPLHSTPLVLVLTFYLLDCLYAERKDRSILFWKSLPVSDAATVASKLLVALAVVPLGVYVVAILSDLLFSAIIAVRASFNHSQILIGAWDTLATFARVSARYNYYGPTLRVSDVGFRAVREPVAR